MLTKKLLCPILSGLLLLVACGPATASLIAWQAPVDMYQGSTVETFVDTTGTFAAGLNATDDTANGNVTVNGVPFTQALTNSTVTGGTGESITINGSNIHGTAFQDGEFSSNASIFHLIRGASYQVNSITLGGLQNGETYCVQVFTNDARGNRNSNFVVGLGDGGSAQTAPVAFSNLNNDDGAGGPEVGDSIIGKFTAMGPTMTFNVWGTNNGSTFTQGNGQAQINAVQLRILPVPEPGSLALLGLGALGMIGYRRRR